MLLNEHKSLEIIHLKITAIRSSSLNSFFPNEQPQLSGPILMLVHDWPLVHRNDGLRRRWAIAQCTMGSLSVVVIPPSFDNNLGFPQRVEDFAIQQLFAHSPIEALAISVLPG